MRATIRSGWLLVAALSCGAAHGQSCSSLQSASWLVGEWRGTRGENEIVERWQKISEQTFEGQGTTSRASKVLESETLRLLAMEQRVFYVAKVAENQLPVAFLLTQCNDGQLVFENPAHDFPKKLEYRLSAPDTLSVRVSAGERAFTLSFSRRKD